MLNELIELGKFFLFIAVVALMVRTLQHFFEGE
jgi:hypothetical protein